MGGYQSLPTGPGKMQPVKQCSHCVLKISWTIKFYAPMNNGRVFHFKYSIRGVSFGFSFFFLQGVFVFVSSTQSITWTHLLIFNNIQSIIHTVNLTLTGDLWHQQRKVFLQARFLKVSFNISGLFAFLPRVR